MRTWVCIGLLLFVSVADGMVREPEPEPRPRISRPPTSKAPASRAPATGPDQAGRLSQIDRLIRMGSLGRAMTALENLSAAGVHRSSLIPRFAALAEAEGDPARVVELCLEGLAERPRSLVLLRPLVRARMQLGDLEAARSAVADLLAISPNRVSAAAQMMDQWCAAGRPELGRELGEAVRVDQGSEALLRRPMARCRLAEGDVPGAVGEIMGELGQNPLNLSLVRKDLLEGASSDRDLRRATAALADFAEGGDHPGAALLRADLLLTLGESDGALLAVEALPTLPEGADLLLRHAGTLAREAPLEEDPERAEAQWRWLLAVLERLGTDSALGKGKQPRVLDLLAATAEDALEAGFLDRDPVVAEARIEAVLEKVRLGCPGSSRLYSAQVKLARHTREVRGEPARAAARLERLLLDLDLPLSGLALCRLELGLSRMAAGDTARARTVLTRLGRSAEFPAAAAAAHYHLARLDLSQGHWETAGERLSAVALADPAADFANEALDLALLAAEEQARGAGVGLLEAYSACVSAELRGDRAARRRSLESFLAQAGPDDVESSMLVSRARLELAALDRAEFRPARAVALCGEVVRDRPSGPYAARALRVQGEVFAESGDHEQAARAWERLLAQYPDTPDAEDARRRLRELP